jgi:hypothetical protein
VTLPVIEPEFVSVLFVHEVVCGGEEDAAGDCAVLGVGKRFALPVETTGKDGLGVDVAGIRDRTPVTQKEPAEDGSGIGDVENVGKGLDDEVGAGNSALIGDGRCGSRTVVEKEDAAGAAESIGRGVGEEAGAGVDEADPCA